MITINYHFDEELFDYDVDINVVNRTLKEYLMDNWTYDDFVDYVFDTQGRKVDIYEYFEEEIKELFEEEAKRCYYERD